MKTLYPIRMKYMFVLSFLLMSFMPSVLVNAVNTITATPDFEVFYDDDLDAKKLDLLRFMEDGQKELDASKRELDEKISQDECPYFYEKWASVNKTLSSLFEAVMNATSMEELNNCEALIPTVLENIYGLRNDINAYQAGDIIFEAKTSEGIDMLFQVINDEKRTVRVGAYEHGCVSRSASGPVTIPSSVTYRGRRYTVAAIGKYAFSRLDDVTSVAIPEGVSTIEEYAFYYMQGLTSIAFPGSVERMGPWAFAACENLSEIILPEGLKEVEYDAFRGCKKADKLVLPSTLTKIDVLAFEGCSNLNVIYCNANTPPYMSDSNYPTFSVYTTATLYVPAGTKGKYKAAEGWKQFQNIVEKDGEDVDDIITFADANVKSICVENWDTNGDGELSYDEAEAVTALGQVFKENHDITSFDELQYFTGLTDIPEFAFFSCEALSSVVIPNSVTAVEGYAFAHSGLKSITIPAVVTSIGQSALWACEELTSIVVEKENTVYDSRDNCNAIILTVSNELEHGCRNTTIPQTVTAIGREAFNGHTGLATITIPNSVTSIKIGAFNQCSNMMLVIIPSSVVSIEMYAFRFCHGLRAVRTFIEDPFPIDESVFEGEYDTAVLYVPTGSKSKYASTQGWSKFLNIVEGDPEDERLLMLSKEVDGATYTIYKEVADMNDIRKNYDGWEMYRTKVTLDITANGVTDTYLIDDALYEDVNSDGQIPCMMFDLENRMMYAFCLSKGEDIYYGMEGYVYSSPMDVVNFQKDQVFTYANWGWWTSFAGMNNGQPQLSHFSFAGYYRMASERNEDGSWTTDYIESIYPDNYKAYWQTQDLMLVLEQPVEIEPLENGDVIDFGDFVDESGVEVLPALDGNVVGNLYFNILNDNGGYDAEEGCIVITESTADETIERIADKDFYDKELRETFTGIIFKVPAGSGNIKITAEALGSMLLKVRIGDDEPQSFELDGRQKVKIPYTVGEETLVYIYAGEDAAVKGVHPVTASSGMLRIFGIESESIPTTIAEVETSDTPVTIYSISGQRLAKPQKGINIIGGKKVVVK